MRRTSGFASFSFVSLVLCSCRGEMALRGPVVDGGPDASTIAAGVADSASSGVTSTPETGTSTPETGTSTPEAGSVGDSSGDQAAPLPAVYQATQSKTLASPLPNASGVTYDGTFLWILAPNGNPQPYTLEQFDPNTLKAQKTFTLPSLFQTLGTGADGIAWDGTSIWVAVAGDTNSLLQMDPTNGQILRSMWSPSQLGPTDLDFDGTDLWLSSGTGEAFRIDPTTGGVAFHWPIAGGTMDGRDDGIAYRTGQVFVGGLFGGMEAYDATTGNDLGAVVHDNGAPFQASEVGPSVFVGSQLVVLSSLGITYYDIAKAP